MFFVVTYRLQDIFEFLIDTFVLGPFLVHSINKDIWIYNYIYIYIELSNLYR